MDTIKEKLEEAYKVRDTFTLGFIGNPGLGKTSIINDFAKSKGKKAVEIIVSQDSPMEVSGMTIPDQDMKRMTIYDLDKLSSLEDGDILFFDEFLNGNIQVLNACLTLITQREMRSGKKLPNVLIVAAGNLQGATKLSPQVKQRFHWTCIDFKDEYWSKYIFNKHGIKPPKSMIDAIKKETFNNESWTMFSPRTCERIIELIKSGTKYDSSIFDAYAIDKNVTDDINKITKDVQSSLYVSQALKDKDIKVLEKHIDWIIEHNNQHDLVDILRELDFDLLNKSKTIVNKLKKVKFKEEDNDEEIIWEV